VPTVPTTNPGLTQCLARWLSVGGDTPTLRRTWRVSAVRALLHPMLMRFNNSASHNWFDIARRYVLTARQDLRHRWPATERIFMLQFLSAANAQKTEGNECRAMIKYVH
jgi:hypothetical protein